MLEQIDIAVLNSVALNVSLADIDIAVITGTEDNENTFAFSIVSKTSSILVFNT